MKKPVKIILIIALVVMIFAVALIGFKWTGLTFELKCKTTEDGFVYYVDGSKGLCIISFPDSEEVVVPEYINGKRVMQFGYEEKGFMYQEMHEVDGRNVKKLTLQHKVDFYKIYLPSLQTLVYNDFLACCATEGEETVTIVNRPKGVSSILNPNVELRKGDKQNSYDYVKTINIPDYVTYIESGVFSGLTGVTIKTSYQTKPEGWQEGWNGDCNVIWGVDEL